jgi:tryptophan-rich sensory protein
VNRTFDIGGPEVLTYREMITRFADATGRRRPLVVTVPVLTPRLASHWVGLVTPISAGLAKPLVGSLVHEVVAKERDIEQHVDVPGGLTDFETAVRSAMDSARPDTALRNLALTGAAVAASAVAGSLATQPGSRWYKSLDLPAWQPPPVAFPLVWTTLYADIAASSATVLTELDKAGDRDGRNAYLKAFGTNLALNTAWSVVFWRVRRPWGAVAEAALLTLSSADLARRAGAVNRTAGISLSPYAVWCGFATALSAAIARRNR